MSTTESDQIAIHVKNMVGDLLTITCYPTDTISQIYTVVQESLEEPHYPCSSLRLLQWDIDMDDFVPLHTLSHDMMVSLFIEDKDIRVEFTFMDDARVGVPYRTEDNLFMDDEPFEEILVIVYHKDKSILAFRFFAGLLQRQEQQEKKQYTDIYYHTNDIDIQLSASERRNEWNHTLFTIPDDATSGQSPADLALDHYGHDDMLLIADKIHCGWLEYVHRQGCEIFPYSM